MNKLKPVSLKKCSDLLAQNALYIVLLLMIIVVVAVEPGFVSLQNFTNILAQSSTRIILALGLAPLIILRGTDLSAGRMIGFSAVVSASLLQSATYASRMYPNLPVLPMIVPLIIVMVGCACFMAISGTIVAKLEVAPFIVTLGMQLIIYGVTSTYFDRPPLGAQPIGGLDPRYTKMAQGFFKIGNIQIPYIIFYALAIMLLVWFLWNKTRIGKNMYAIGGNPEAASVSGVNIVWYTIFFYVLAGLLYGLAGYIEAARIGSATNSTGLNYDLDAIAACVVGGVSFSGGVGTVTGVITGVLILQVINYGLTYISVTPYMQFVIKGIIIITAVALDMRKYRKKQ